MKGKSAQLITNAINNNMGGMRQFKTLTQAQISSIAAALATSTPAPNPGSRGAALYNARCAACHGPLATSAVGRKTPAQIRRAINSVGAMRSFKRFTRAQVKAIAQALANSTPSSGATTCSACHYANGKVKPGAGKMPGGEREGRERGDD